MRLNMLFYIGANKEYSRTFFVVHVARARFWIAVNTDSIWPEKNIFHISQADYTTSHDHLRLSQIWHKEIMFAQRINSFFRFERRQSRKHEFYIGKVSSGAIYYDLLFPQLTAG